MITQKSYKIGILLSATSIGGLLSALDSTIVNIGLKVMKTALAVNQAQIQWVIISYLLSAIAFTPIAGDLGDKFTNKTIYQIGLFIFSVASLLCFFSKTLHFLIIFRVLQGIGGAGLMANTMAIVSKFSSKEKRGLAIGISMVITSIAISLGPILGGILTEKFGWSSIFLINVPLGLLGLIWAQFAIPNTKRTKKGEKGMKTDFLGIITLSGFLLFLVFSFTSFVDRDFIHPIMYGAISLGISFIFLVLFVLKEKKTKTPLIDLKMFKDRNISIGLISALFIYLGLCVIIYQLPFYLQEILGFGQIKTGAIIVGTPISMAIVSIIVGIFSKRISAKYISTIGFLGIALAFTLMAVFLVDLSLVWFMVMITIIIGVSLGAFFGPNSNSILSSAPKEKVGIVSGMLNLISLVGYSLGTALSTTIFEIFRNWFQKSKALPIFLDPNAIPPVYNPANYNPSLRFLMGIFAVIMTVGAVISYRRTKLQREKRKKHLVHIHFFQH